MSLCLIVGSGPAVALSLASAPPEAFSLVSLQSSLWSSSAEPSRCGLCRWRQPGLAQADKVHFTPQGYKEVADLLFEAILSDYYSGK